MSPQTAPDNNASGCGREETVVHCLFSVLITSTLSKQQSTPWPPTTIRVDPVVTQAAVLRGVGIEGKALTHIFSPNFYCETQQNVS